MKQRKRPVRTVRVALPLLALVALGPGIAQGSDSAPAPQASSPGSRILLCFGVYTQWYRIEEAAKGMPEATLQVLNAPNDGAGAAPAPGAASAYDAVGSAVAPAVSSADAVSATAPPLRSRPWDVIVLGNVNRGAFPDEVWASVVASVREGAGLLMLGGPFTYGEGKFGGCPLLELLPIESLRPFDLKWARPGLPILTGTEHPVTEGVDLAAGPQVLWLHNARPKAGATVTLKAGSRPLLVVGTSGSGRVAAFLGTPLGETRPGQLAFWEWQDWPRLIRQTLAWLAGAQPSHPQARPAQEPASP
jgi:hypothetical protein